MFLQKVINVMLKYFVTVPSLPSSFYQILVAVSFVHLNLLSFLSFLSLFSFIVFFLSKPFKLSQKTLKISMRQLFPQIACSIRIKQFK